MARIIQLKTQRITIAAPGRMVYEMLTAIGRGALPGAAANSSRVVSQDGNVITAEFFTKVGLVRIRTLEEITLYPYERITYRHLEGPIDRVEEEFALSETDTGMQLEYRGWFSFDNRFKHYLLGPSYYKPTYDWVMRQHLKEVKKAAEARAARSHVYRQQRQGSGD